MESDRKEVSSSQEESPAGIPTKTGAGLASLGKCEKEPPPKEAFWKEIYWFVIVCAIGATVALWILPQRAARHQSLLALESERRDKSERLENEKQVLEAAIDAMENDPWYQQAVWRKVLGVKKNSEEFLETDEESLQATDPKSR